MDTGTLIALIWRRDRAHERVRDHYRTLRQARDGLLTSNLVLAETATRLRYDVGLRTALTFRALVEEAVAADALTVRHADAGLEARAASMFGLDADFSALGFALES